MTNYQSKLEKKEPCQYCGGPHGECLEGRGGFLPEWVCKKRPTYDQLAVKLHEADEDIRDLTAQLEKLIEVTIPGIKELQDRLERHEKMLMDRFNVLSMEEVEKILRK